MGAHGRWRGRASLCNIAFTMKSVLPSALLSLALCYCLPTVAAAHSGGKIDDHGCHHNRAAGDYHCHMGPARGHSFASRGEMLAVLENGNLSEHPVEEESSWWDRLNPFKTDKAELPSRDRNTNEAVAAAPGPVTPSAAAQPRSFEERLKVLKGLRELDLITEQEYETRRREILSEL